jgi:uncharacterized MAPEG superfamily protein
MTPRAASGCRKMVMLRQDVINVPVLVLLGYAAWTLLTLFCTIGVYRWGRILTGRASIGEWRADVVQGCEWYRRAMRAHMNCIENLPVYAAIVVAVMATGLRSAAIDRLAVAMLAARVSQTLIHVALPASDAAAAMRFAFFFAQVACMIAMGKIVTMAALAG